VDVGGKANWKGFSPIVLVLGAVISGGEGGAKKSARLSMGGGRSTKSDTPLDTPNIETPSLVEGCDGPVLV